MSTGPARCSEDHLDVELAEPDVALAKPDVALA